MAWHSVYLEAACALEIVAFKLGKSRRRLYDRILGLLFFFPVGWGGFGPRSAGGDLDHHKTIQRGSSRKRRMGSTASRQGEDDLRQES